MPQVKSNGLSFEVERHGAPDRPPLLLIRGLGSQLIHWPEALIDGWEQDGFHVITFDNRDVGLSSKCPGGGYGLTDMAQDTLGLLDALGIARAHVVGMSMGGLILQILARLAPDRVQTATIVMSTSGAPGLPQITPEAQARLAAAPPAGDRDSVIARTLEDDAFWGSPGFPFDPAARAALIGRAYDRCHYPDGAARQLAALMADRDQSTHLPNLRLPVLVIHGADDALIPAACGRDIAARIPGAAFLEIAGMGHDLEGDVIRQVRAAVTGHATQHG
jgi:proline iminopeptidase